ncbi:MAG: hypothetical protein K2R98_31780 [Gemmataceae bacterium]|nr:hypothetical protein [Gemmataceae bacterium]
MPMVCCGIFNSTSTARCSRRLASLSPQIRGVCPCILRSAIRGRHYRPSALARTDSDHGCLPTEVVPLFGALDDSATVAAARKAGQLFIAFGVADLVILRRLGLPATLATGLHKLELSQLRRLDTPFPAHDAKEDRPYSLTSAESIPRRPPLRSPFPMVDDEAARPAVRPSLLLVGWSPAHASRGLPIHLPAVARSLGDAIRHLHLTLEDFAVWRPGKAAVETLRYRLDLRDTTLMGSWLQDTLEFEVWDVAPFASAAETRRLEAGPAPPSLPDTLARLHELFERYNGRWSPEAAQLLREYHAHVVNGLLKQLSDQALQADEPLVACLRTELAGLVDMLLRSQPQASIALSDTTRAYFEVGKVLPSPLDVHLKLLDQVLKLATWLEASASHAAKSTKARRRLPWRPPTTARGVLQQN